MRTNLILAILAAVLAWPVWQKLEAERTEDFTETDKIPLLFPGFSADRVARIDIARRKSEDEIKQRNLQGAAQFDSIVFVRDRSGWVLEDQSAFKGLPIDSALVERDVLEHLAALRRDQDTLVPPEKVDDKFRELNDLTDEKGTIIICRSAQDREIVRLVKGKATNQGKAGEEALDGYFVNRPDRPKEVVIYEPKSEYWRLSLRPSDWAEKTIHDFLMGDVARFVIKNEMGQAGFTRKRGAENTWVAIPELCPKDAGDVKQSEVDRLVENYRKVVAESFIRQKVDTDSVGAAVEIRATLKDGTEYSLFIGKKSEGKNTSRAVSAAHRFLFEMSNFYIDPFRRQDPQDLFTVK